MIHVVADENIPCLEALLGNAVALNVLPGNMINSAALREADALLVRSVTRVDRTLLESSRVRFVGTATAGSDHINRDDLAELGIAFADAPGSNADSVVEYVLAALLDLAAATGGSLAGKSLGIVGVGAVGGRLARRAEAFEMRVLRNDPPRAEAEPEARQRFVSLDEVLAADVVSIHVPLTGEGEWPTRNLLDEDHLVQLERRGAPAWFVHTARGGVVNERALGRLLDRDGAPMVVLDVWENEPGIDASLARRCHLCTPHIAGYSRDAKVAGARMVIKALAAHFRLPGSSSVGAVSIDVDGLGADRVRQVLRGAWGDSSESGSALNDLVRQMYDIRADDRALRTALAGPEPASAFRGLRKNYPQRPGFGRFELQRSEVPSALVRAVRDGLGIRLV